MRSLDSKSGYRPAVLSGLVLLALAPIAVGQYTYAPRTAAVQPNVALSAPAATADVDPTIAADPLDPNRLAVAYRDAAAGRCAVARSSDDGKTWGHTTLALGPQRTNGRFAAADHVAVAWAELGPLYCATRQHGGVGAQSGVFVHRSPDGGRTFTAPVTPGLTAGSAVDGAPAIAVDGNANTPRAGAVYLVWTRRHPAGEILVTRSTDGGTRWSTPVAISDTRAGHGDAAIRVGPGGELHVTWIETVGSQRRLRYDRSTDGGASWAQDRTIATFAPWTAPFTTTARPPSIIVDDTAGAFRGDVHVAWTERHATGRAVTRLAHSRDRGTTWNVANDDESSPMRVDADVFFPELTLDAAGGIVVTYAAGTLARTAGSHDVYVCRSVDGGRTFGPATRVTERTVDPSAWSRSSTPVSRLSTIAHENRYHAVWVDTRGNAPQLYTSRFSFDLVPNRWIYSISAGGSIDFSVAPGPNHVGRLFIVFVSMAGTSPGIKIGNLQIDLNPDYWTTIAVTLYGHCFQNFYGNLGPGGVANGLFTTPPGLLRGLEGRRLSFVGLLPTPRLDCATSPQTVQLVP